MTEFCKGLERNTGESREGNQSTKGIKKRKKEGLRY
jgi:hypothetical protein